MTRVCWTERSRRGRGRVVVATISTHSQEWEEFMCTAALNAGTCMKLAAELCSHRAPAALASGEPLSMSMPRDTRSGGGKRGTGSGTCSGGARDLCMMPLFSNTSRDQALMTHPARHTAMSSGA